MSRFFFHLSSSQDIPDSEGVDLDSLHDARCYAVKMIAEVLCTAPERYWDNENYRVTATDERGLTLFMVEMTSTDSAAVGRGRT